MYNIWVKESEPNDSLEELIDRKTPDYGIQGTYPSGLKRIFEKFKSHFEAEFWQVGVTNAFAKDNEGKPIDSSIIVEIDKTKHD
jgi:hypothetical protein